MTRPRGQERATLDGALIAAHERGDGSALAALYREAGEAALAAGNADAACFYFTHAYVFALETGDPSAQSLRAILVSHGREEPEPL